MLLIFTNILARGKLQQRWTGEGRVYIRVDSRSDEAQFDL